MQDSAAQQCWYSSYNTGSEHNFIYTGKFAKMVHPYFFYESGGRSPYHSDLESK